ncbi:MAG: hypothetical protein JW936_07655 [Sedimentisphaerales bacterium]|nr:hypothetical protein [Sedimentisphaerales bacterium]
MIANNTKTERLACQIASMSRKKVTAALLGFRGKFKMDFTRNYLDSLSLDRLRHILLAAYLNRKRCH